MSLIGYAHGYPNHPHGDVTEIIRRLRDFGCDQIHVDTGTSRTALRHLIDNWDHDDVLTVIRLDQFGLDGHTCFNVIGELNDKDIRLNYDGFITRSWDASETILIHMIAAFQTYENDFRDQIRPINPKNGVHVSFYDLDAKPVTVIL